jgi:hypothetical protein
MRVTKAAPDGLATAVAACQSMAQVLRRLGLRVGGANYRTINRAIRRLGLDVTHWTGQGHRRGAKVAVVPAQPLCLILCRNSSYNSHRLRRRLIAEGVLAPRCESCSLEAWLGQKIPLELDHKDGDRSNNELANLRLLCPNCHAFTPTYRGRNVRLRRRHEAL